MIYCAFDKISIVFSKLLFGIVQFPTDSEILIVQLPGKLNIFLQEQLNIKQIRMQGLPQIYVRENLKWHY